MKLAVQRTAVNECRWCPHERNGTCEHPDLMHLGYSKRYIPNPVTIAEFCPLPDDSPAEKIKAIEEMVDIAKLYGSFIDNLDMLRKKYAGIPDKEIFVKWLREFLESPK